jgi:hypothetical protein
MCFIKAMSTKTMSKKERSDSYSHILKYIGLFGGVQVLSLAVALVRNKLVALILGSGGRVWSHSSIPPSVLFPKPRVMATVRVPSRRYQKLMTKATRRAYHRSLTSCY